MRFDIITIFPNVFHGYLNESIIARAQKKGIAKIKIWDLRKFTKDKHHKIDDRPFGGGPGMVMQVEPIVNCLTKILKTSAPLIVFLSASGKQFNANLASDFAKKYKRVILIAGHYEGVDARIKKIIYASGFKFQELSIGPYVLTGGELPAMVVIDAMLRKIPGVLGKAESLEEKRYGVGVPAYTRPEAFKWKGKTYKVPKILLSGDHKKIENWRIKHRAKDKANCTRIVEVVGP